MGAVKQMNPEEYHADPHDRPSLSSTLARVMLDQSPLHAWTQHPRLNPDHEPVERKVFDIGRAVHRAVLGAGGDYVAIPDELLSDDGGVRTKEAKAWVADAQASGLTPLKAHEVDAIGMVSYAVRERLALMGMAIDRDRSELAVLAEVEGCPVRAMIDNAPPGKPYLIDIKSTTDASPDACIRAVTNYGLDVQARFYLDTWEAATGERRKMRFVFVEKAAPYGVGVVELHDDPASESDWMLDAASKCAEARRLWRECLEADHWPDYPARVAVIGAPGWYRQSWANRELGQPIPKKPSPEAIARARAWQAP
jgi:hypothetical protein